MHNHIRAQCGTGQLCTAEAQPSGKSAAGGGSWRTRGGGGRNPSTAFHSPWRGCSDALGAPVSVHDGLLDPPIAAAPSLGESPRRRGNLGIPPDPQTRHRPMTGRQPESLRHPADFVSRRQEICQEYLTCCAVVGRDRAAVPRNEHIDTSVQPQSALIPASGRQMEACRGPSWLMVRKELK